MLPRRRLRKFILWTGTTLCVLIAAAFVVSAWLWIVIQAPTSRGPALSLSEGAAWIVTNEMKPVVVSAEVRSFNLRRWNSRMFSTPSHLPVRIIGRSTTYTALGFPLWLPFVIVLLPTLLVWWLGRKRVKPGHCPCGYDLTGNVSGTCPECGVEVKR